MSNLTPDALDRVPFPLEAGYRIVSRPAKNSVVIAPRKVGALYTDDDFKALEAYATPFGFAVLRHGEKRGYAYILGPLTRPDAWLAAFLSDGGVVEAARKRRAQEEAEAKREKEVHTDIAVLREHISSPDCWCEPELDYKDPDTGAEVWVHRELQ